MDFVIASVALLFTVLGFFGYKSIDDFNKELNQIQATRINLTDSLNKKEKQIDSIYNQKIDSLIYNSDSTWIKKQNEIIKKLDKSFELKKKEIEQLLGSRIIVRARNIKPSDGTYGGMLCSFSYNQIIDRSEFPDQQKKELKKRIPYYASVIADNPTYQFYVSELTKDRLTATMNLMNNESPGSTLPADILLEVVLYYK